MQGGINHLYNWNNGLEEKNYQHLNRTSSFTETNVATCVMWDFQDKLDVTVIQSTFILLGVEIIEPSKAMQKL